MLPFSRLRCVTWRTIKGRREAFCDRHAGAALDYGAIGILIGLTVALLVSVITLPRLVSAATAEITPVRFGFSRQIFGAVNENDGRAALKAYAQMIVKDEGIPLDVDFPLIENANQMNQLLRTGSVDMVTMPTNEFFEVAPDLMDGPLIVAITRGRQDDEYLLIVRNDSGVEGIAGLKGRRLIILQGPRTPLAMKWLDVLTLRESLGPAEQFLGPMTYVPKSSRAVLPVFFKQADAAVVNRGGFQVMGELNPQINTQMRVLVFSQPMITSVMCFRKGLSQKTVDIVVTAALKMHTTVSGRQVLTIFQSEKLDAQPRSCLDSARELLAEHARLLSRYQKRVPGPTSDR